MSIKLPWREREQRSREAEKEAQKQAKEEARHRRTMRWTRASFALSFLVFLKATVPEIVAVEAISYTAYYTGALMVSVGLVDLSTEVDNPSSQTPIKNGIARIYGKELLDGAVTGYFAKIRDNTVGTSPANLTLFSEKPQI